MDIQAIVFVALMGGFALLILGEYFKPKKKSQSDGDRLVELLKKLTK